MATRLTIKPAKTRDWGDAISLAAAVSKAAPNEDDHARQFAVALADALDIYGIAYEADGRVSKLIVPGLTTLFTMLQDIAERHHALTLAGASYFSVPPSKEEIIKAESVIRSVAIDPSGKTATMPHFETYPIYAMHLSCWQMLQAARSRFKRAAAPGDSGAVLFGLDVLQAFLVDAHSWLRTQGVGRTLGQRVDDAAQEIRRLYMHVLGDRLERATGDVDHSQYLQEAASWLSAPFRNERDRNLRSPERRECVVRRLFDQLSDLVQPWIDAEVFPQSLLNNMIPRLGNILDETDRQQRTLQGKRKKSQAPVGRWQDIVEEAPEEAACIDEDPDPPEDSDPDPVVLDISPDEDPTATARFTGLPIYRKSYYQELALLRDNATLGPEEWQLLLSRLEEGPQDAWLALSIMLSCGLASDDLATLTWAENASAVETKSIGIVPLEFSGETYLELVYTYLEKTPKQVVAFRPVIPQVRLTLPLPKTVAECLVKKGKKAKWSGTVLPQLGQIHWKVILEDVFAGCFRGRKALGLLQKSARQMLRRELPPEYLTYSSNRGYRYATVPTRYSWISCASLQERLWSVATRIWQFIGYPVPSCPTQSRGQGLGYGSRKALQRGVLSHVADELDCEFRRLHQQHHRRRQQSELIALLKDYTVWKRFLGELATASRDRDRPAGSPYVDLLLHWESDKLTRRGEEQRMALPLYGYLLACERCQELSEMANVAEPDVPLKTYKERLQEWLGINDWGSERFNIVRHTAKTLMLESRLDSRVSMNIMGHFHTGTSTFHRQSAANAALDMASARDALQSFLHEDSS